jgi:hypothetical protein
MKTDVKGCSTCQIGQEQYESFISNGCQFIQYDYRHTNGKLFSTVATTLEKCRQRRDTFIKLQNQSN